MHVTKNMYLDKVYKLYVEHFTKFCILVEINANNHDFYGFLWFHHENQLVGNFLHYIRNQRDKMRKYAEIDGNWKVHQFVTTPLIGFSSFFFFV